MITRKMTVYMDEEGYMRVVLGQLSGTVSRENSGWVWNIYEDLIQQRSIIFGSSEQQWMAYGELLANLYELST